MTKFSLRFIILVALFSLVTTAEEVSKYKCVSSVGDTYFQSQSFSRPQSNLRFCNQHRLSTCCNRTHTEAIIGSAHAYLTDEFGAGCRDLGLAVACSPCDYEMGIGKKIGICKSLCVRWFGACRNRMFFRTTSSRIQPCAPNTLVCSPLRLLVDSGTAFCEASGFTVTDQRAFSPPCFDGKSSIPPLPPLGPLDRMGRWMRGAIQSREGRLVWRVFAVVFPFLMLLCVWRLGSYFDRPSKHRRRSPTAYLRQRRLDALSFSALSQKTDSTASQSDKNITSLSQAEIQNLLKQTESTSSSQPQIGENGSSLSLTDAVDVLCNSRSKPKETFRNENAAGTGLLNDSGEM
eukprot:477848_1